MSLKYAIFGILAGLYIGLVAGALWSPQCAEARPAMTINRELVTIYLYLEPGDNPDFLRGCVRPWKYEIYELRRDENDVYVGEFLERGECPYVPADPE